MKITDLFAPFADELQLAATPRVSNPPLVEWTSAWGDLFFCVKGAEPQITWCDLGRGAPEKRTLSKARLATLNKYISQAFAGRTFFRVVPFAAGDDWALVRPKRALVKSPVQRKGAIWQWRANFPVPNGEINWLSQPVSWFENWLKENADDELQITRDFARVAENQRATCSISYRNRNPRIIWESLIPNLQKLSPNFPDSTRLTWSVHETTEGVRLHCPAPNGDYFSHLAIHDLLKLLKEYFPLYCYCVYWRDIGVRGKKTPRSDPRFIVTNPTQHEKLEAALLWRDFGREIGESERVEAALAQLLSG